jgi:hypothetical protein
MTYIIDLRNDKLAYRKVLPEVEKFRTMRNETNYVPAIGQTFSFTGAFYKVVKVKKSDTELFFGYFQDDPSSFWYGFTTQQRKGHIVLVDTNDWANRCVWELGMEKIRPSKYIEHHIIDLIDCVRSICDTIA